MKRLQMFVLWGVLAAAQATWGADAPDAITERLNTLFAGQKVTSLEKAPLEGFYEAVIGGEVLYVSEDANFLLHGSLYDLRDGLVNVTEQKRDGMRLAALAALDEKDMIVFGPQDAAHTITVFTDIDCGYCRKLHSEIDKYGAQGIRVRYLSFPRSGPGTESFRKAEAVWCSDDRQKALTAAKKGDDIPAKECENPVLDQYNLGRELGVTGTPALVLEDGQLVPGYVPADRLRAMLDAASAEKKS